jgi:hypothetical protein
MKVTTIGTEIISAEIRLVYEREGFVYAVARSDDKRAVVLRRGLGAASWQVWEWLGDSVS